MRTKLQEKLANIAQAVFIETSWEHDTDSRWDDPLNRDWTKGEDEENWQAWQCEVCALTVYKGRLLEGFGYIGGFWMEVGKDPDPEMYGYEKQKTAEALSELLDQLKGAEDSSSEFLRYQLNNAIAACR